MRANFADSLGLWLVGNPEKPNARFSTDLKGHSAPIEKVAFNPVKDAELCSVSSDGTVKFWDVRTKNCFNEVRGLGEAFTLAWAPGGDTLIVGNKVSANPFLITFCVSYSAWGGAFVLLYVPGSIDGCVLTWV